MPTEIHTWRCNKCHRTYPTFAQASECEETCTATVVYKGKADPNTTAHYRGRHDA